MPTVLVKQVSWIPPPQHWIKINTDESFIAESGVVACGGIAGNHENGFVLAWSTNLSSCSVTLAKLSGAYLGLYIGQRLDLEIYC